MEHQIFEVGATGANHFSFFNWGANRFFTCWLGGGEKEIGNGCGCLSCLLGVKISDLVPLKVSQTWVDYQRTSWYVLGCFSLNKIPEISITETILMIWLEPPEHIDKAVFIFWIFNFLLLNWYFLGVGINCCHSHTDKTCYLFAILEGSFLKFLAHM